MDSVIKGFLGLFLILVMALLGFSVLSASIDARNADSFVADCVEKMEASNLASGVVQACVEDAADSGYRMTVDVVQAPGTNRAAYGMVTLEYEYQIPLLGTSQTHSICADVR
jgi:hypothetical protein